MTEPKPNRRDALLAVGVAVVVTAALFGLMAFNRESASSKVRAADSPYYGEWRDADATLMRLFGTKRITGCGEMYMKPSRESSHEKLVYCTRDGKTWTSYVAFTMTGTVQGPFTPTAAHPPPY